MLCGPPPLPTHTLWTPPSCSPWDPLKDIAQFEQDGVLHTLQRETAFLGSPGPRHQVRTSPGPSLGFWEDSVSSCLLMGHELFAAWVIPYVG